jgi:hypothetical protein
MAIAALLHLILFAIGGCDLRQAGLAKAASHAFLRIRALLAARSVSGPHFPCHVTQLILVATTWRLILRL